MNCTVLNAFHGNMIVSFYFISQILESRAHSGPQLQDGSLSGSWSQGLNSSFVPLLYGAASGKVLSVYILFSPLYLYLSIVFVFVHCICICTLLNCIAAEHRAVGRFYQCSASKSFIRGRSPATHLGFGG